MTMEIDEIAIRYNPTLTQVSKKVGFLFSNYQWRPAIVKAMEEDEEFKAELKEMIDGVLPLMKRRFP